MSSGGSLPPQYALPPRDLPSGAPRGLTPPPPPLPPKSPADSYSTPSRPAYVPPPAPPSFDPSAEPALVWEVNEPPRLPTQPVWSEASIPRSPPSEGSSSGDPGSYRLRSPTSTPRKRIFVKGKVSSPARTLPRRPRERERDRDRRRDDPPRPGVFTTLNHILGVVGSVLNLAFAPIRIFLGPIWWHLVNTAIIVALAAGGLYAAIHYIRSAITSLVTTSVTETLTTTAIVPLRALATPACLLANIGCGMSLLSTDNTTAQPIWKLFQTGTDVDVAAVSRGLSQEARQAKDIFDSLTALGDGRMTDGLGHVRIHELGVAIRTGSTLEERFFISSELIELSDLASDLLDEIVQINAMSVNIFSWLFWEFTSIVQLLSLPPSERPSSQRLGFRLDNLINRLDQELDRLFLEVDAAIPVATRGKDKGWMLFSQLSEIHSGLKEEHDRFPGWQRVLDASKRFFAGGDPSKLMRIRRDLELTQSTITGIDATSKSLERVRIDLNVFRTQIRAFKGSVMGLHLGASEEIGLGPEQEMLILSSVVDDLGAAVGRAKQRPKDPPPGIDSS